MLALKHSSRLRNAARTILPALALSSLAVCTAYPDYPVDLPPRKKPVPGQSSFKILPEKNRQVIAGIGFEIQSDSINSGNNGVSDALTSVPHDLVPAERERFFTEMLKGFRYCRLAGGLYWRGLDPERKRLQGRWPEQMDELKAMMRTAGIEGVSLEYWSPAPFWKANGRYEKPPGQKSDPANKLRCFGADFADDPVYKGDKQKFLADFGDALKHDIACLKEHGIPVSMWGLQNEPTQSEWYATCRYSLDEYAETFSAVAPLIRQYDPKIMILADSMDLSHIKRAVERDPGVMRYVDALVVHQIGWDSNSVKTRGNIGALRGHPSAPRFQNEYEYLSGRASPARCLNTVQNIMNWFQIAEAPTWFWIHALKPMGNSEASGYSLGFWNPANAKGPKKDAFGNSVEPGHWTWNRYNWNAVGSFVRHMPWDCVAVAVEEKEKDEDIRILAFKKPGGKLAYVLSNRCGKAQKVTVDTGRAGAKFLGYRYTPEEAGPDSRGIPIAAGEGAAGAHEVPNLSWEFWEEQ